MYWTPAMLLHLLKAELQKPRWERLHNVDTADVVKARKKMIEQLRLSKVFDFSNLKLANITEKAKQVAKLLGCAGDLDVSQAETFPWKTMLKISPKGSTADQLKRSE